MRTNFFFNGSWIVQLFVGFGLFGCSFFVEYQILIHFISPQPMALFLAVTLEGGKVAAIVWHYYLGYPTKGTYPLTIRLTSLMFRFGLVTLSLLCSMLFFTSHLDRPNLTAVKAARSTLIEQQTARDEESIKKQYRQREQNLLDIQYRQRREMRQRRDTEIQRLEALLIKEMDNVVNGAFKGQRYLEFERRIDKEKAAAIGNLTELQQQHTTQLTMLTSSLDTALNDLRSKDSRLRAAVAQKDFTGVEQAHDKRVVALLNTIKSIFNLQILPLQFVFFYSILISLLMETGIMLSFATITVAIAPVLHARHMSALEQEACRVKTEGTAEKDMVYHHAAMDRVRKATRRVVNDLGTVFS